MLVSDEVLVSTVVVLNVVVLVLDSVGELVVLVDVSVVVDDSAKKNYVFIVNFFLIFTIFKI